MAKKLNRLLITGASGALGSHCRQHLKDIARIIRVTDKLELTRSEANQSEEIINCDLSDYEAQWLQKDFLCKLDPCNRVPSVNKNN